MARAQIQRRERRELNSHEVHSLAGSGALALTQPKSQIENSLISSRAGVNAGQCKYTRTPPLAATDGALLWAPASSVGPRMREHDGRCRLAALRAVLDSKAKVIHGTRRCKARGALQSLQPAP